MIADNLVDRLRDVRCTQEANYDLINLCLDFGVHLDRYIRVVATEFGIAGSGSCCVLADLPQSHCADPLAAAAANALCASLFGVPAHQRFIGFDRVLFWIYAWIKRRRRTDKVVTAELGVINSDSYL
ncbi:Uncharacterised protein [Mycobacteroides abscessus subsp. abscessus]|nr:Uncharacterised protein [Mycobacteroides abscessus subsp. abscessus]